MDIHINHLQLHGILDDLFALDPFHSDFRPGLGAEMALEALADELHSMVDRRVIPADILRSCL